MVYVPVVLINKEVYKEMVAGGEVARRNPRKQWYSKKGLVVEEQYAFGFLVSEYFMFRGGSSFAWFLVRVELM